MDYKGKPNEGPTLGSDAESLESIQGVEGSPLFRRSLRPSSPHWATILAGWWLLGPIGVFGVEGSPLKGLPSAL